MSSNSDFHVTSPGFYALTFPRWWRAAGEGSMDARGGRRTSRQLTSAERFLPISQRRSWEGGWQKSRYVEENCPAGPPSRWLRRCRDGDAAVSGWARWHVAALIMRGLNMTLQKVSHGRLFSFLDFDFFVKIQEIFVFIKSLSMPPHYSLPFYIAPTLPLSASLLCFSLF